MADISQELDRIADQFAVKVGLAKEEVVNALMDLMMYSKILKKDQILNFVQ